jgi:hypothetical protein
MRFRFILNSEPYGVLVLKREPDGWKDVEFLFKRSLEYHGIFNEAMAQLAFTCSSGKEYIDKAIREYGVDAQVFLTIQISCTTASESQNAPDYSVDYSDDYGSTLNDSSLPLFETLYEGVLNLENYSQTRNSTVTDIIQSDFIQKIINRLETTVEITRNEDLDGNELSPIAGFPSDITLHSKALVLKTEWAEYDTTDACAIINPNDSVNVNIPMVVISDDIGGANDSLPPLAFTFFQSGSPRGYDATPPIFENTTGAPITLDFNINITANLAINNTLGSVTPGATQIKVYLQPYGVQFAYVPEAIILQNITGLTVTGLNIPISINYAASHTIASGDKVFFTMLVSDVKGNNVAPSTFTVNSFTASVFKFSIKNVNVTDPSSSVFFKIHEVGSAIAQRISGQNDSFRSELLGRRNTAIHTYPSNGCLSFAGMVNGKHIRGFGVDRSPLFMSMRDYYKTIDSISDCGLSVVKEDSQYLVKIDRKDSYYSQDVIMQCPRATIKISSAKEYYTSDVTIGYEKWETENINGLDEFNTQRQYNTGIKAIESRRSKLSPSIASMYSIELTRRKGVSTVDSNFDKDNFIICTARGVDGSGNPSQMDIVEKNENFDSVTNVISPETSYNLRISPARNMLRHLRTVSGSIYKFAGRAIKLVYGEGNYTMTSDMDSSNTCDGNYNNQTFDEGQDIIWDSPNVNGDPIWVPEYIDFEYPLKFSEYLAIKNSPFGCIEVSESDTGFIKGYIIEIRYKPVYGIGTFKLLRAYAN